LKKWLIAGGLVAAVGAGAAYFLFRPAAQPAAKTETAQVVRADLVRNVSADGRVVSNLDIEIKCKASGEVIRLPFDVSDRVKKGDLLAELDPEDESRSVRQAEAALRMSEAKLAAAREKLALETSLLETDRKRSEAALRSAEAAARDARAKADRLRDLLERKLVSREEWESAETTAARAAADLDTARAGPEELTARKQALEQIRQEIASDEAEADRGRISLDQARQRLADTRVRSPMDGIVTSRNVQVGQIISSPISNVGGGTTILVLSDLERIFVLASVDEADIGEVRLGQPAKIIVDAFPGRDFSGSVVRIAPRGVSVSNVVTFEVKIEVTSPDKSLLLPEMTANASIFVARKEGVLQVPAAALFRRGGAEFVTVVKADGTQEERTVTTGITDGQVTEIGSGLSEGENVAVEKVRAEDRWQGRRPRGPFGM
jgi:HlyD family secretion protein